MIKCKLCDKAVADEEYGLCRKHYTEAKFDEWLDNTDPDNLGIVKWCYELMPEFASHKFAKHHINLFLDMLKLYDPNYRNKYERLYELIAFRESAKSTAANTLFCSYILANNGKSFKYKVNGEVREFPINEGNISIVSETATSAEEFTVRIRDVFTESERLRYFYSFQIQDAIDSITGQWTRNSFRLNGCWVIAVGSGQQIRGKVKGAARPTLLIADDIYSENNTVSEDRRNKIKKWWHNSVMNSIDNVRGKVVVLGTILHEDTVLVELKNNPQWITKEVKVMDLELFHEFVKEHLKIDHDMGKITLPYDEISDKDERLKNQRQYFDTLQATKNWKLAWPERIDLFLLAQKYKEAYHNQSIDGLYQEYFHIIIPPESKRFRPEFFQTISDFELKYEYGYNWLKVDNTWKIANLEFGVDLSGMGLDDTVISVVAVLPDNRLFVLHQAIGKWSLRDVVSQDTSGDLRLRKVILDRSVIQRVGVIDEIFRLWIRYHPSKIKVGIAGEEEQVLFELQRVFQENRVYNVHITGRPQTVREGKKEQRIMNTLLGYYETKMIYHAPQLIKLEHQLEYLGKAKHDDAADSLEVAVWQIEAPYSDIKYEAIKEMTEVKSEDPLERYRPKFDIKHNWREYA